MGNPRKSFAPPAMSNDSFIALCLLLVAGFVFAGASSSSYVPAKRMIHSNSSPVYLVVYPDGTCHGVKSQSGEILWTIPTGAYISQSEGKICISEGNCLYPGPDGSISQLGNLTTTIQDLVQQSPIMVGSMLIVGSKTSSVLYVDLHTGELLHQNHFPDSINATGHVVLEPDLCRSVVMIVRTNYFLNSTENGRCSWRMSYSSFNSIMYGCHRSSVLDPVLNAVQVPVPSVLDPVLNAVQVPAPSVLHPVLNAVQVPVHMSRDDTRPMFPALGSQSSIDTNKNKHLMMNGSSIPDQAQVHENKHLAMDVPFIADQEHVTNKSSIPKNDNSYISTWITYFITFVFILFVCFLITKFTMNKKTTAPRKRKGRKGRNGKANASANSRNQERQEIIENQTSFIGENDGRWIGKLLWNDVIIGKGSNGTVVYEGVYDNRLVAVKRLVRDHNDIASKEIQNLILSDQHSNIVRYYGKEEDMDFVYIALERCQCSLSDFILHSSGDHLSPTVEEGLTSEVLLNPISAIDLTDLHKNIKIWDEDGFPTSQLVKLMRDIVFGVAHLHSLGIIHRDMKPQNILINRDGKEFNAKLSDMGISKHLINVSSMSHHSTGFGSFGWQAPEQLKGSRLSSAMDLFGLGCILFFCLTKGKHPFGCHTDRISNILNNRVDLFLVDHIPEAVDLISQLLEANPENRPSAKKVLFHPFFWKAEMRLSFLRDASDRVELEDRENEFIKALESVAPIAFGGKWGEKLDPLFISDMSRYRKYNFCSTRDLLRVIRNKLNHYRELSVKLQEILGSVPQGFDSYFTKKFPNLVMEVYKVISIYCSKEDDFHKYLGNNL